MRHYIADIDAAVDTATASLPPPDASAWTVPGQDFSQPQSQVAPPANGWAQPPPLVPAAAPVAPAAAAPAAANGQQPQPQPQPAANQGSWFEEMTAASTAFNGAASGAAGGAADGAAGGQAAPASAAPASAAKSEQAAAPYPGGDEIPF